MSREHKKLISKADKTAKEADGNKGKRKPIVLEITISSDEDDTDIAENLETETKLVCSKSRQSETHKKKHDNERKEDNIKLNRSRRNVSQKEQQTDVNRESESGDADTVLSQSDKTKIETAVKRGRLHRLGKASANEDSEQSFFGPLAANLLGSVQDKDPNDTEDFSGETTPYRAVITKNLLRQEQLKRESKLAKRSLKRKKPAQTTESTSSLKQLTCENSPPTSEVSKTEGGEKEDSNAVISTNDDALNVKKCITCLELIQKDDYEAHRSVCLMQKFRRSKKSGNEAVKNVGLHCCQICQADITGLGTDERTDHVNACIDKDGQEKLKSDDNTCSVCQICKKNLSRYNSQRKTQHINRCADELEEQQRKEKEEQAALEKARYKILDCPLCGQHLKTSNGRKTHMKKCALKYGVSVVVLQQQIKQQEEEYARKLEAGLVPLQPAVKKRKKIKSTDSTSTVTRPEEPISKADADLQLAVALSESIHKETTEALDGPHTSSGAFGVLMTPKVHKHTKRKTKAKPTPALLLAEEETVAIRLCERVARLIVPPEYDDISLTPQLLKSRITSAQTNSLWERSVGEKCNRRGYYVEALMPPLAETTVTCGSKIRRLSSIPGREDTSLLESPDKNNKENVNLNNTTMIATTQTALLLAEMDEDQSLMDKTCDNSKSFAEQDLNATGFIFPEDDDIENRRKAKSSYEQILTQQEKMINNKTLSDLSLETADGIVYAHKYPIALKCPALYKHIEKVSRVDLKTYGKDVVLAMLRYLYVDDTLPKDYIVEDLKTLSARFGIQELAKICSDNLERRKDDDEKIQTKTPDLNALLKKVWGSDEDSDETSDDELTKLKEEAEIDAVYEFMASQRSNGQIREDDSSDTDLSEIDESSSLGGKKHQDKIVHNSQHTFLDGEILKELLTPSKEVLESIQDCVENNDENPLEHQESVENEDMNLHLTASEADEVSEDDGLLGSPLVRKFRNSIEQKTNLPELQPEGLDEGGASSERSNDENESLKKVSSAQHQPRILVCERCPLTKDDLGKVTDYGPESSLTMTRKDLHGIKKDHSDVLSWSVTICSTCSPCKEAEGLTVKESDKEIMSKVASRTLDFTTYRRKSSYETPVMSRTWSATTSVTPDLFDTSTATEEYSMNLSHLSVNNRSRKYSASTSELFNNDDSSDSGEEMNEIVSDKDEDNFPEPICEQRKSRNKIVPNGESTHDGNEDFVESPRKLEYGYDDDDDDDVVALSQEEVAKLPKSRSPSPVFGSQLQQDIVDQSVVKEEKGESDSSQKGDIAPKEPDWLKRDSPQSSNKPKKFYSFKSKKLQKPKHGTPPETEMAIAPIEVESPKVERRRSSLSLSQKRKKRGSSEGSQSCSPSFSSKKYRTEDSSTKHHCMSPDDTAGEKDNETVTKEYNENNSSRHDEEDAIDLTQEESPEHCGNSSELQGNYNLDLDYDDAEEIQWQDDEIDDGVLVMEEPEPVSPNQSVVQQFEEGHNMSTVYDPPTDMETDYSMLCNDSVLWNDENEPKVPSVSKNMLKTPSAPAPQSRKKPLSEWVPPSPFTPMPHYDSMATPELKRQCKKYGIRPLPKKRMQATLKTIHAETHAYETDSDFEQPLNKSAEEITVPRNDVKKSKNSATGQKGKQSKTKKVVEKEKTVIQEKTRDSTDSEGTNEFDSSRDSLPDMLEESMMPGALSPNDDEDDVTPSQVNVSPKSKEQRAQEKKMQKISDMKKYIRSNPALWGKILQYEVFEFDDLKDELTNAGIKVGNEVLTDFLDEMNIQFTLRNHQGGRQRKKGKGSPKKKGSPRKRGRGRPKINS